jgi:hypothetical protein
METIQSRRARKATRATVNHRPSTRDASRARPVALRLAFVLLPLALACGSKHPASASPADAGTDAGSTADAGTRDFLAILTAAKAAIARGETQIDLDGDGRPEYTRFLSDAGLLLREEIDVTGSGVPDLVWDHTVRTSTFVRSVQGTPVETVEVTLDPVIPDKASFVVTEMPLDPSVPFTRALYTVDPNIPTIAVENDTSTHRDGNWDVTVITQTTLVQPDLVAVPTQGAGACTPKQAQALTDAFNDAVTDGLSCIYALDPDLMEMIGRMLVNSNVQFTCTPTVNGACADVGANEAVRPWRPGQALPDMPVTFHPNAFTSPNCSPLAATAFHEILHYALGPHLIGDGTDDPADRVYACENTCFADASRQTCAACLASSTADPACSCYPDDPCSVQMCTCGDNQGTLYPDDDTCQVACPGGLGCFGCAACQPRGPCQ